MSKRHLTTRRDRESRKYRELHRQLAAEVAQSKLPEPDKTSRKRQQSRTFRATGNL